MALQRSRPSPLIHGGFSFSGVFIPYVSAPSGPYPPNPRQNFHDLYGWLSRPCSEVLTLSSRAYDIMHPDRESWSAGEVARHNNSYWLADQIPGTFERLIGNRGAALSSTTSLSQNIGDETMKQLIRPLAIVVACAMLALPRLVAAQATTGIPPAITTPDKVETRIGTLEFKDGAPSADTVQKVYDNLDYVRGVDAFMNSFSGASAYAIRQGFQSIGAEDNTVVIFSELMDSNSLFLTANADTIYTVAILDLTKGPLVVEVPPMALGTLNDMWFGWIIDIGFPGPDRGEGGKYLIVPPDYDGPLPDSGFHVSRSKTTHVSTPFASSWRTTIQNPPSPRSRSR